MTRRAVIKGALIGWLVGLVGVAGVALLGPGYFVLGCALVGGLWARATAGSA